MGIVAIKVVVFLLALVVGFAFIIWAEPLVRFFGKAEWAERRFRTSGGSYLLWKLVGLIFILVGFLFVTGTLDPILWP